MGKVKFNGGRPQKEKMNKQEIVEKIVIQEKIVEVPVTVEKIIEVQKEQPIYQTINEIKQVVSSKDAKARKHSVLVREGIQKEIEKIKIHLDKCILSHDGSFQEVVHMISNLEHRQMENIQKLEQEIDELKLKKPEEKQIVMQNPYNDKKIIGLTVLLFTLNLLIILLK